MTASAASLIWSAATGIISVSLLTTRLHMQDTDTVAAWPPSGQADRRFNDLRLAIGVAVDLMDLIIRRRMTL